MRTTYFENDDILVLRFSDKEISREVAQDWNMTISYAADGSVVDVVMLDAWRSGAVPMEMRHDHAA